MKFNKQANTKIETKDGKPILYMTVSELIEKCNTMSDQTFNIFMRDNKIITSLEGRTYINQRTK